MNGIDLIMTERIRQIEQEGWTAEHDDATEEDGDLAAAAASAAIAKIPEPLARHIAAYWKPR